MKMLLGERHYFEFIQAGHSHALVTNLSTISVREWDGQTWTDEELSNLYTVLLILRYVYMHATQAADV